MICADFVNIRSVVYAFNAHINILSVHVITDPSRVCDVMSSFSNLASLTKSFEVSKLDNVYTIVTYLSFDVLNIVMCNIHCARLISSTCSSDYQNYYILSTF